MMNTDIPVWLRWFLAIFLGIPLLMIYVNSIEHVQCDDDPMSVGTVPRCVEPKP